MTRKLSRNILIIIVLILSNGCYKDKLTPIDNNINKRLISLHIPNVDNISMASRSYKEASELTIHRGYVFIFNAEGEYVNHSELMASDIVNNGTANISIAINNKSYTGSEPILFLFNYDDTSSIPTSFEGMTTTNFSTFFPMSSEFLAKLQSDLDNGTFTTGVPMFSTDFPVGGSTSSTTSRVVYRSIAKIELSIADGIVIDQYHAFSSENVSMGIYNVASSGNIAFDEIKTPSYITTNDDTVFEPVEGDVDNGFVFNHTPNKLVEMGTETAVSKAVYLYEYPYASKVLTGVDITPDSDFNRGRITLMLKHLDDVHGHKYYRLDIADRVLKKYLDVRRNHHYKINIKAVHSSGYITAKEAYNSPSSNIEYEIFDIGGDITHSNGQYAISLDEMVEYDEVTIFDRDITTIEFRNICYILPDEMTDKTNIDVNSMTNIVDFSITSDTESLTIESISNDFNAAGNGIGKLGQERGSVSFQLKGSGVATLRLIIKFGNIQVGREVIKISKNTDEGSGSFDAHAGQLILTDRVADVTSWSSHQDDFGVRINGDGNTVIFMGENVKPTGFVHMDGSVADENSPDAYPIFTDKRREAFYSYKNNTTGTLIKTKLVLNQLSPFYVGRFGGRSADGSSHLYKPLVMEKIEEVSSSTPGVFGSSKRLRWASTRVPYYSNIYDFTSDVYLNRVDGLAISNDIIGKFGNSTTDIPYAVKYCYMKNDTNGDGILGPGEPINWYLPAYNQIMGVWINYNLYADDAAYRLGQDPISPFYLTSSEFSPWASPSTGCANVGHVISLNVTSGEVIAKVKNEGYDSQFVRCVRDLDVGGSL